MEIKKIVNKDRLISLIDDIDESTSRDIINKIREINADDDEWFDSLEEAAKLMKTAFDRKSVEKTIKLFMSTYGGVCYDGLALYDVIRTSNTPVEIEVAGKIMSMGIIVMLASSVRKAHKNTTFMIHQISGFSFGKMKDMEESVEQSRKLNEHLFNIILENTNISKKKLQEVYDKKYDYYLTAEEALNVGLITEIID